MMDDAYAFASLVPSTTAMDIVRSWNTRKVQTEVAAEFAAALALAVLKFAFARISARDLAEEDGGGDDE
jgi:hypothetical protein